MKMYYKRNKILTLPVSVFLNQHMPTRSCDVSFSRNSLSPDIWGRSRENGEQPFLQADRHHPFLYLFFELTFPVNTDPVQAVQTRRINGTDLAGANTLHIQVSLLVVITRGKWPVALLATLMQTFRQKESADTIGVSLLGSLVHHLDL